jgi:hypothetical protein
MGFKESGFCVTNLLFMDISFLEMTLNKLLSNFKAAFMSV